MLLLKACPHCHGDLASEQDAHTSYLSCVQCGHVVSVAEERRLGVRVNRTGMFHLPLQPPVPASYEPRGALRPVAH